MKLRSGTAATTASAALPGRIAAGIFAAALAAALPAAHAATYTVTAQTTGSAADFRLPGLFDQGDLRASGPYDLTVTGVFDSANVESDASRQWLRASDVALQVTLRVGEEVYTLQTTGQLSTQVFMDADGDGRLMKRLYQSMVFDPAGAATNYGRFEQYLFLDAHQFPVASVLEPVTAYYADPIVKGFTIQDALVDDNGTAVRGEAFGRAETFRYQVALAVPEPGTWAMLGAGLAIVACAARRRRA